MSLVRGRALRMLFLLLFLLTGMVHTLPAVCCLLELPEAEPASDCCCPAEEPQKAPEQEPCDDREECPRTCCNFRNADPATPTSARVNLVDSAVAPPAVTHAPTLVSHELPQTRIRCTDPPPTTPKTQLHLRLQVLLC